MVFALTSSADHLRKLQDLIWQKNVAVVGNASDSKYYSNSIDDFDVVVRMNLGYLQGPERPENSGKKTTIIAISGFYTSDLFEVTNYVVWMTHKLRKGLGEDAKSRLFFYPIQWWKQLADTLNETTTDEQRKVEPSTGLMVLHLLLKLGGSNSIKTFGFDGWNSETWYEGCVRPGPHSPLKEVELLETWAKHGWIELFRP